jgi:putative transposase
MSRFRLLPTPEEEEGLLAPCRDARYVWNLAVEQQRHWQPGRKAPGYGEQCAQLTEARAEYWWLRAGSQTVQQQALRDFAQAMRNFFAGTHRRPTWRKAGVHEGFRQVGLKPRHVERVNRRFGRVWVPKIGWVRFRLTRPVPNGVKSYRVTRDRAGRWHVAFTHIPDSIAGPADASVVGIDRGVAVSAALSTGGLLHAPSLAPGELRRLKVLQQRLARCRRGSNRREKTKRAIAKLKAREKDRRKRLGGENHHRPRAAIRPRQGRGPRYSGDDPLRARHHRATRHGSHPETRAQPRNKSKRLGSACHAVAAQGFGPGRADPGLLHVARCSACGHVAPGNRKSQAVFECQACEAGRCNADVNAARNIAAGRAVTARGDLAAGRSANREPQLATPAA